MADNSQSSTVSDNPRHTIYPDESNGMLLVRLPLTTPTGKVRVKRRDPSSGYVSPVSTRKKGGGGMRPGDYIEWQIGYDLAAKDKNKSLTNLHVEFERSKSGKSKKKEKKFPYELSELLYYARQFGWVGDKDLLKLYSDIGKVPEDRLLENLKDMRTSPRSSGRVTINEIPFEKKVAWHTFLIHDLSESGIFAEVQIREKQRAVGIQPMLYFCIPFGNLDFVPIIPESGRLANKKEKCGWSVGKDEGPLILNLFRILGMLSLRHRDDTLAILSTLFPDILKTRKPANL